MRICHVTRHLLCGRPSVVRLKGAANTVARDYVLPDYTQVKRGFVRPQSETTGRAKGDEQVSRSVSLKSITTQKRVCFSFDCKNLLGNDFHVSSWLQIIRMNNERFSIPEILFHPSDVGIQEMGLSEAIVHCIENLDEGAFVLFAAPLSLKENILCSSRIRSETCGALSVFLSSCRNETTHVPEHLVDWWKLFDTRICGESVRVGNQAFVNQSKCISMHVFPIDSVWSLQAEGRALDGSGRVRCARTHAEKVRGYFRFVATYRAVPFLIFVWVSFTWCSFSISVL